MANRERIATVRSFSAERVRSLDWCEDALVDWVDGGTRFDLDGARTESRLYDIETGSLLTDVLLDEPPGAMMPVGDEHVLCLYRHPRLVSLDSGDVVASWPELSERVSVLELSV